MIVRRTHTCTPPIPSRCQLYLSIIYHLDTSGPHPKGVDLTGYYSPIHFLCVLLKTDNGQNYPFSLYGGGAAINPLHSRQQLPHQPKQWGAQLKMCHRQTAKVTPSATMMGDGGRNKTSVRPTGTNKFTLHLTGTNNPTVFACRHRVTHQVCMGRSDAFQSRVGQVAT